MVKKLKGDKMIHIKVLEASKSTYAGPRIHLARCSNCNSLQVKSSIKDDKVFCTNCRSAHYCGPILSDYEVDKIIESGNYQT